MADFPSTPATPRTKVVNFNAEAKLVAGADLRAVRGRLVAEDEVIDADTPLSAVVLRNVPVGKKATAVIRISIVLENA